MRGGGCLRNAARLFLLTQRRQADSLGPAARSSSPVARCLADGQPQSRQTARRLISSQYMRTETQCSLLRAAPIQLAACNILESTRNQTRQKEALTDVWSYRSRGAALAFVDAGAPTSCVVPQRQSTTAPGVVSRPQYIGRWLRAVHAKRPPCCRRGCPK